METETITAPATDVEDTGPQLSAEITVDNATGQITRKAPKANWFKRVRLVRSHPSVKLARILSISPALCAAWSVEVKKSKTGKDAPPEAKDLIANTFLPMRNHIVKQALLNLVDFGFSPFEVIWTLNAEGALVPKRLKPLLVDSTKVVIEKATGKYQGLYQEVKDANGNTKKTTLELPKALLFNQNVEGTNWYGRGDMEDVEPFYTRWETTEANYAAWESKYSGAHWVITYPVGTSLVNGVEKNNSVIARELLAALRANGSVTVPRTLRGPNGMGDLTANKIVTDNDWTIELVEPKADATSSFDSRFNYLDVSMIRAMVVPERAVTEGKHGTKAEAEAHADAALTYAQDRHSTVLEALNKHVVDKVLVFNFGEEFEGCAKLISEPVGADEKLFLRDLYKSVLSNQQGFALEVPSVDTEALKKILGVPIIDGMLEDDRLAALRNDLTGNNQDANNQDPNNPDANQDANNPDATV